MQEKNCITRKDILNFISSVDDYCTQHEMNRKIGIFCLKMGEGYKQLFINDIEIDLHSIDCGTVYNFISYVNFGLEAS